KSSSGNPRHRMFRHLLASPKYGLLHSLDMPTPCEEHLRRRLGTLSVSLAYSSLLLCYWSNPARHLSNTMFKPGGLILYGRSSPAFQGGATGHLLRRLSIVISFSVGGSEAF